MLYGRYYYINNCLQLNDPDCVIVAVPKRNIQLIRGAGVTVESLKEKPRHNCHGMNALDYCICYRLSHHYAVFCVVYVPEYDGVFTDVFLKFSHSIYILTYWWCGTLLIDLYQQAYNEDFVNLVHVFFHVVTVMPICCFVPPFFNLGRI